MKSCLLLCIVIGTIVIGCKEQTSNVSQVLLNEIKTYIKSSEDYEKLNSATYIETNIYLVKLHKIEDKEYFQIFENNYYFKDGFQGYLEIGDNSIFFYEVDDRFINENELLQIVTDEVPDERSDAVNDGFNSQQLYLKVNPDLSLTKIDDENFLLGWW